MFEQIIYIILSLISFVIVNSVGKALKGSGYEQIELEESQDYLPGFNLIFRIVFPIILIIFYAYIISLTYYQYLNEKIYLVNLYYLGIRLIYTFVFGNYLLLNVYRQVIIYISIFFLNKIVCDNYLYDINKLLPNFENFINEIWLLIILFLYKLSNELIANNENIDKRKNKFILFRFNKFKKKYYRFIEKNKGKPFYLEILSLMIYEDYNRPYSFRWVERILKFLNFNIKTTGIMQITSNKLLSDNQSIIEVIKKIRKKYIELLFNTYYDNKEPFYYQKEIKYFFDDFINQYNVHSTYSDQIYYIYSNIVSALSKKEIENLEKKKNKLCFYIKIREIKFKKKCGISIDEPSLKFLEEEFKKVR